jgi:non-specific serine/threonine protein kinase
LGEYYSILDLCLPGLMGDYDQFKSQTKIDNSQLLDLIIRRTRPFVLRRTKDEILKELPAKTESDVYLELTERQKVLYQQTVDQVRASIDEAYTSKTRSQAQIIALTAILKLRQLCVSPRLLDSQADETSPKIEFLIGKLNELRDEGHSALVFSQFTTFLDLLEEDLRTAKLPFSRLDGSTPVRKRKELVEGFQKGDSAPIFLLSLKAGGQGLNLTRASYVFHLDPWWNPAVENQASDRAHRIGQTRKVSITRILMRHTIEEKMMELKKRKVALYRAVLGDTSGGRGGFSISRADFDFLLSG